MTAPVSIRRDLPGGDLDAGVVAGAVVVASVVGVAVGLLGAAMLAALVGAALMIAIAVRPAIGGVLLLGVTPLVVGIDRGVVVPLLRPNEALLALVSASLVLRGVWLFALGRRWRPEVTPIHVGILAMAVTSSVTPLLWMAGRGHSIELDDVLYASAVWKYLVLFLVVRAAIRTEREVGAALAAALGSGVVVAVVAVTQSMGLFGVPALLSRWYVPSAVEGLAVGRGSSTLSSAIAVGDVMAILLAAVIALGTRYPTRRLPLSVLGAVFVIGAVGSGQFSGVMALVIAAAVAAWVAGRLRRAVLIGIPVAVVVGALLWPVVGQRLEGFTGGSGVPQSWTARLENLRDFFWPTLTSDFNWTLGVRPSARIPAPEPWREWVFIESGHTWLLWNGGLPLLLAFFGFLYVAVRTLKRIAPSVGFTGVAATAALAAMAVLGILITFDPHLTMRGTADLSFAVLALALVRVHEPTAPPQPRRGSTVGLSREKET
ncbi:MAG TPA: hypothetical protein VJM33_00635 [Microthrixaceae bacterium]|nr:hypothetical protein [Microthrixaceae bacterium]